MRDDNTFRFKKGDHAVNVARLGYQQKRVTNPKKWADLTEGQRQQWREWYQQEQKLKNAKNDTTNKKESDEEERINDEYGKVDLEEYLEEKLNADLADGDGQDNQ